MGLSRKAGVDRDRWPLPRLGLTPATSAPGLGSPPPHLRRAVGSQGRPGFSGELGPLPWDGMGWGVQSRAPRGHDEEAMQRLGGGIGAADAAGEGARRARADLVPRGLGAGRASPCGAVRGVATWPLLCRGIVAAECASPGLLGAVVLRRHEAPQPHPVQGLPCGVPHEREPAHLRAYRRR